MLTNRKVRMLSVVALVCALMLSLVPATAYAATKKVTVGYKQYTTTTAAADKAAKTVKKGTTKLTYKKGSGYLKFKAPKTATYKFTMSNVKGGKNSTSAYFHIMTLSNSWLDETPGQSISPVNVKTQGGTNSQLLLGANGKTWTNYNSKEYSKRASRYGKLKLTKGQTAYIYFTNGKNAKAKTTATLVIK